MNNAAINTGIQVSLLDNVFVSFGYVPRSGIAGLWASFVFDFLRTLYTVLHSHWTSLHSHQQGSTLHDVTYMWGLKEKVKLIELGSRKVIARDWGGGNRERLVNGYKLSVLR